MRAGELAQGHGHGQSDKCGQGETKDHSRPGNFESRRRPQQQAGSDRAADSDHRHLAGAELVAKALFLVYFVRPPASGTLYQKSFPAKAIFFS